MEFLIFFHFNPFEGYKKIRHISVGDRYAELSQRVNKNTNANIDLSADDYAEFLDINKRLVPPSSKNLIANLFYETGYV